MVHTPFVVIIQFSEGCLERIPYDQFTASAAEFSLEPTISAIDESFILTEWSYSGDFTIYFDWKHDSFWGGSSYHGEDYGISL